MSDAEATTAWLLETCPDWCEVDPADHASHFRDGDTAALHERSFSTERVGYITVHVTIDQSGKVQSAEATLDPLDSLDVDDLEELSVLALVARVFMRSLMSLAVSDGTT